MFKSKRIRVATATMMSIPATIREHVERGGDLYVVEDPRDAISVMISTHPDPTGHVCTNVRASDITHVFDENDAPVFEPGGLDFIIPGASVIVFEEKPVRATVEATHVDGTVELTTDFGRSIVSDVNHIRPAR